MANKTKYDPQFCEDLINEASRGLTFEAFAGKIRVSKQTLYTWAEKHKEFGEAKEIAQAVGQYFLEVFGLKGARGELENFNVSWWIFSMRNRCGWRNDPKEGDVELEDKVQLKPLTTEERKALIKIAREVK